MLHLHSYMVHKSLQGHASVLYTERFETTWNWRTQSDALFGFCINRWLDPEVNWWIALLSDERSLPNRETKGEFFVLAIMTLCCCSFQMNQSRVNRNVQSITQFIKLIHIRNKCNSETTANLNSCISWNPLILPAWNLSNV